MVEPPHLRLSRNEGLESSLGSGLTDPDDILMYVWLGDHHYRVHLVSVSSIRWLEGCYLCLGRGGASEAGQTHILCMYLLKKHMGMLW